MSLERKAGFDAVEFLEGFVDEVAGVAEAVGVVELIPVQLAVMDGFFQKIYNFSVMKRKKACIFL